MHTVSELVDSRREWIAGLGTSMKAYAIFSAINYGFTLFNAIMSKHYLSGSEPQADTALTYGVYSVMHLVLTSHSANEAWSCRTLRKKSTIELEELLSDPEYEVEKGEGT